MDHFELISDYKPTGDQPEAIAALCAGLKSGKRYQTLQGVTGSGKTFTIANVIAQNDRPVLVLSHNKTLAAQLYSELKSFFPENAVEYFVSYYDYYLPESINDEIEKLRLSATASLIERRDTIIVSSVSCIYSLGAPEEFTEMCVRVGAGDTIVMESCEYYNSFLSFTPTVAVILNIDEDHLADRTVFVRGGQQGVDVIHKRPHIVMHAHATAHQVVAQLLVRGILGVELRGEVVAGEQVAVNSGNGVAKVDGELVRFLAAHIVTIIVGKIDIT